MGRKHRRAPGGGEPVGMRRPSRRETGPLGDTASWYLVVTVPPARADKVYRCPGCDHTVDRGIGHVVAWPEDDETGDWRRHWHSGCWDARARRSVTRRWS